VRSKNGLDIAGFINASAGHSVRRHQQLRRQAAHAK
jgi:hypothetical protein